MNPFEVLSDDPILHIFSYLPRNDLLKLTMMDKNFNRIITESRETNLKIPLVLNIANSIAIADVIELARKRQFRALKLMNIFATIEEKFMPLLELLSGSVEHLEISSYSIYRIYEDQFSKLLQLFIPKLKTFDAGDANIVRFNTAATISDEAISNHPLKSLIVKHAGMVKFFSGCKQLKSFEFRHKDDTDNVYEFLAQQTHLEKLKFNTRNVDLNRMIFAQLKELSLTSCVEFGVPEYLEKLPNLTKLHIEICYSRSLHRIMKAICNAPKLEELYIIIGCSISDISSEGLKNRTIKTLRTSNDEAMRWLLQIFHGVELVGIALRKEFVSQHSSKIKYHANLLDPSDLPLDTIDKIELAPVNQPFRITFSPRLVPANFQSFEASVKKFAIKFSARIDSIKIGDSNWLNNDDFKLPNSFCEGLVQALPNLVKLELYNVANRRDFHSFLLRNRRTLKNLKEVKTHRNIDEVRTKKMRIDADADTDADSE